MKNAIVIGASSDIGTALCQSWTAQGWKVTGTFRTQSEAVSRLQHEGVQMVPANLDSRDSVEGACRDLQTAMPVWDVLVLGPGLQDPVGLFTETDFDEWSESITVNFTNQMRFVHRLLPSRNRSKGAIPAVLFFAGGGTNNAPTHYSAYIVSKIGLVKMTELLAAEVPDASFTILGPGWVKTKIHESTLKAKTMAGANYERTLQKLESDELTPMKQVVDCCTWLVESPRECVSGRNFSVVFDKWGDPRLDELLIKNPDMYKLRRFGNEFLK